MQEYITLLRNNRNYRNLWLASVITQLGDWFNLLASAELITRLTNSGIAVSYLFLARFLPLFLFSPIAGVLADRYSRRLIMILTDLLRAATVLGFLLVRSPDQVWLLYLLTATQFTLSALFTPARSAVLANVVPARELVAANALDSLTWSTMLAMGAFLGGVVAALFGTTTAFIADSFTFVLSAFFVSRIVIQGKRLTAGDSGGWLAFLAGVRYLWHEPFILGISMVKAAGALVWGAINVLEIVYADEIFALNDSRIGELFNIENGGTAVLGIIWVVSGLGTGLGPLFLRRRLGDKPEQLLKGISIGFLLIIVGIAALSIAPNLGVFLLATLIRTVGSGAIWVFSAALLQMIVPDRYRGRVFAFEFAMLTLTQSISILAAGYLQDARGLSVREVTAVSAAAGVVVGLIWLMFFLRNQKMVIQKFNKIEQGVAD